MKNNLLTITSIYRSKTTDFVSVKGFLQAVPFDNEKGSGWFSPLATLEFDCPIDTFSIGMTLKVLETSYFTKDNYKVVKLIG